MPIEHSSHDALTVLELFPGAKDIVVTSEIDASTSTNSRSIREMH